MKSNNILKIAFDGEKWGDLFKGVIPPPHIYYYEINDFWIFKIAIKLCWRLYKYSTNIDYQISKINVKELSNERINHIYRTANNERKYTNYFIINNN